MKSSTTVSAKSAIFALSMTSVDRFFRTAVSFIFLAAVLFFSSFSAFADFRLDTSFVSVANAATGLDIASGAAIDGALSALSVNLGLSAGASLTTFDLIKSIISGSPFGTLPDYTYSQPLSDILNQETIKIRPGSVTIDGVEYSDVWLPHDVANKFRVNAFDFITHYNIISQSNGIFVSGVGFCDGIPLFSNGSLWRSSDYIYVPSGSYSVGNVSFSFFSNYYSLVWSDGSSHTQYIRFYSPYFIRAVGQNYDSGVPRSSMLEVYSTSSGGSTTVTCPSSLFIKQPFDFTWVSGSIPVQPLPSEQGLRFRVPSSYVSDFPSVVSPDLADYAQVIVDLSNALEQARLANVVESTAFEEFDAPAPPVPSTGTIAEEPYSSLDGSLTGIQDSLDNIDTNIGTVDESLDDIQVFASDAADSLQSIDTNLSQSVADTAGIKGFIQQYLPGVHSLLSSISSSVSDIAGSIAAADQTFFGNVVDSILAPFTPVFDIFKAGVGIWRYVVAWVGNISAPFSWIWSILSQSNGILVSPILASAAAAVVLAVYKKFGR